jgi:hypothetical protein
MLLTYVKQNVTSVKNYVRFEGLNVHKISSQSPTLIGVSVTPLSGYKGRRISVNTFLFTTASRQALGSTQPPIHGYQGFFPWG